MGSGEWAVEGVSLCWKDKEDGKSGAQRGLKMELRGETAWESSYQGWCEYLGAKLQTGVGRVNSIRLAWAGGTLFSRAIVKPGEGSEARCPASVRASQLQQVDLDRQAGPSAFAT